MSQKQLQAWHVKNLMNLYIHAHINVEELIGVSLSKSHTSGTALHRCVSMHACLWPYTHERIQIFYEE